MIRTVVERTVTIEPEIRWSFATSTVWHHSFTCALSRARRGGWAAYMLSDGDEPLRPCRSCVPWARPAR